MVKTIGFKLDADTAARLRLATGARGQSAALRRAMVEAVKVGSIDFPEQPASHGPVTAGLTVRVSDDLAMAWQELVGSADNSAALRSLAAWIVAHPPKPRAGEFTPRALPELAPVPRAERATVTLHLAASLHAELIQAADAMGVTPARWAASWLSARLSQQPSFVGYDALAIRQVANQIAAIGRNINSIARAMNVEAGKSRMRDSEVAAILEMGADVLAFRKEVGRLTADHLTYWIGCHA